jgi:hypothetical protein
MSDNKAKPECMKKIGKYIPRFLLSFLFAAFAIIPITTASVHAADIFISAYVPTGQVGQSYSATFTATSGTAPYTWTITGLPSGVSVVASTSSTISVNGTPTAAGSYSIFVQVSDSAANSGSYSGTITINQKPITFSTSSIPTGTEGESYAANIAVSGGTSPYTWSVSTGSLPKGIVLESYSSYGYLVGTPSSNTAGTYTFTITVSDSSSPTLTNSRSYTIYIEEGTYEATISVGAGLESGKTKVYADGSQITSLAGGDSVDYSFALGDSVTISVDPTVEDPTDSNTRYRVEDEEMVVSSSQLNAAFDYYTEYYVEVKTDPPNITTPSGTGWYKLDKTLNLYAEEEIKGDTGTLYRFTYWLLPSNNKINSVGANYNVEGASTITAHYDTYYQLSIQSIQGETEGAGWYEAGSTAHWNVVNDKVPMTGLIGLFQGKYKAVNPLGSEIMDGPKSVIVFWEADYSLPYILIPLTIILIIAAVYGIYWLMRRSRPPAPSPAYGPPFPPRPMPPLAPPPRPIPQHHTTVVMIGDKGEKQRQLPQSTKEQLLEKFGELLETYENEIKATMSDDRQLGAGRTVSEDKRLSGPRPIPHPIVDEEEEEEPEEYKAHDEEEEEEERLCNHVSKKLLRTITGKWRQSDSKTVQLSSTGKEGDTAKTGLSVVWARDIYQEWEIQRCSLLRNHKGNHKGDIEIVYTLLNTVTEEKTYSTRQKMLPPKSHFTDGMDQEEIPEDQIVPADELP